MPKVDLHSILADARQAAQAQQTAEPLDEIKARIEDAPEAVSIRKAITSKPSLDRKSVV